MLAMNAANYQADTMYGMHGYTVADAPVDARRTFIRKTYTHLAAAIYAFVAIEWLLFSLGFDQLMMRFFAQTPMSGFILMGAFLVTSWVANSWAHSDASVGKQYAGLSLYVLLEAIIFVPILTIAQRYAINMGAVGEVGIIPVAAVTTLIMFGGLTAIVFFTKQDFSFLRTALMLSGIAAFALIVVSAFAGFNLGVWFSAAMVIFACGYILYDTSNVLHHYRPTQHVAASLALFASVALLFFYILRILIAISSRD
jgi:FtsH-binding integral membrane protein